MVILEPTIPSGFGDKMRVLRQIASLMIQQHMGSFSRRGLAIWFPLPQLRVFFHRINMFRPAPPSRLFQRVTATHLRAEGRFPGNDSLPKLGMRRSPWFVESCVSIVAVFKDAKDESTLRSVLIIQDKESNTLGNEELTMEACEDINSRRRAEFLSALLHQYYLLWERAWNGCLDKIDDSVKITLEDISDDTRLDTFMFDGANFERSRSYFAVLQLLRIFSDRIKETRKDLMQVIDQLGQNRSLFKSTGLEEAESRLVERIDRKTEEIKTLRDGLFNSTSVREATRATQMNRYVIVFTVVTVLYTPPSFISALFATPLPYFTKGDPDDFKRAVGIATGTTVLAAIILLVIAYSFDNVVRNPKDRLVSMVKSTRRRGRSIVAKSQSFTRVPFQTVQEAGRALREFAGKAVERVGRVEQRGTQNSAPQQSRGKTDQRQDIDLSDRTANAATPRNDHGGNIV
ncbi:hypothetical protein BJ166DRAFT_11694 [Pestalotiopsis sp. NC0098]|nr:hypothetical protein BJ166DRAFT_11694 [Pestalotiopsis sp. NC0098]